MLRPRQLPTPTSFDATVIQSLEVTAIHSISNLKAHGGVKDSEISTLVSGYLAHNNSTGIRLLNPFLAGNFCR